MKIALCLSGQPRLLERGYNQLYIPLKTKYNVDVFVHTWFDRDRVNIPYQGRRGSYPCDENTLQTIMKLYSPIIMHHEPQKIFDTPTDAIYESCIPNSVYSLFYSMMICNNLKSFYEKTNNFEYDIVIRSRFDIVFANAFSMNLEKLNLEKINLYEARHPILKNIPNDQFAIGNSKNMNQYSNVYSNIQKYYNSGFKHFVGEHLLGHHLTQTNLNMNFTDDFMTAFPERE
jgi:hypothetical protein